MGTEEEKEQPIRWMAALKYQKWSVLSKCWLSLAAEVGMVLFHSTKDGDGLNAANIVLSTIKGIL